MTLEILGAGFGRTGTYSLRTALNRLGYPCYHMSEVLENPANRSHLDFWHRVAFAEPGSQHDWNRVFAGYRATMDNPGCCVWRELLAAHPQARVILTLHPRGPHAWYESTLETIYAPERMWQFSLVTWFYPRARRFRQMSRRLIWGRSLARSMDDRNAAVARYQAHIEDVRAAVPPEQLLIFSADQGWEPLCRFLGTAVPDEPFPRVNERHEIQAKFRGVARGVYASLAMIALAVGGGGWLAVNRLAVADSAVVAVQETAQEGALSGLFAPDLRRGHEDAVGQP